MNPKLSIFLATGDIPKTSKERNLLLDLARLEISQTNKTHIMSSIPTADSFMAKLAANPREAAAFDKSAPGITRREHVEATLKAVEKANLGNIKPAPPTPRSAAPMAIAKPASVITGLVTAASFAAVRPVMTKTEFDKLSAGDKSRFISQAKGKLIDDPKPAEPTHKNGELTREGFNQLTNSAKNEYIAKGNRLAR